MNAGVKIQPKCVDCEEMATDLYNNRNELSPSQKEGRFLAVIEGNYATSRNPMTGSEKPTLSIPTPSALSGIAESVYVHPGFHWKANAIYVMNQVHIMSTVVNELTARPTQKHIERKLEAAEKGILDEAFGVNAGETRQQRYKGLLTDVKYIVEYQACIKKGAVEELGKARLDMNKFAHQFKRRIAVGGTTKNIYLGEEECGVDFRLCTLGDLIKPSFYDGQTIEFGRMSYMPDYTVTPRRWYYYSPVMINGRIDIPLERDIMGDASCAIE